MRALIGRSCGKRQGHRPRPRSSLPEGTRHPLKLLSQQLVLQRHPFSSFSVCTFATSPDSSEVNQLEYALFTVKKQAATIRKEVSRPFLEKI